MLSGAATQCCRDGNLGIELAYGHRPATARETAPLGWLPTQRLEYAPHRTMQVIDTRLPGGCGKLDEHVIGHQWRLERVVRPFGSDQHHLTDAFAVGTDSGQGQVGAIAHAPQAELRHAERLPQGLDVACTLGGGIGGQVHAFLPPPGNALRRHVPQRGQGGFALQGLGIV